MPGYARWPTNSATPDTGGGPSPATIPPPPCGPCSRGPTRRWPPTRHACSGCSAYTPAPTSPRPPQPGVTPARPHAYRQAIDWFTVERPALLAAVDHAAATSLDTHTWQLAWALRVFLDRRGHWHEWTATERAAVAAAQRLTDPAVQALTHRTLARPYT